jgi:predicted acylesterase/phospholipase RssA
LALTSLFPFTFKLDQQGNETMEQSMAGVNQARMDSPANRNKPLCLLVLDGGGVRGLSSLQILKQLMEFINPEQPPKPSDYFDMIGGTSTGGLIAIMLGRLQMSVDECMAEYQQISSNVFTKVRHRLNWRGQVQGRFDHEVLADKVREILVKRGLKEDELLKDPQGESSCRTYAQPNVLVIHA